MAPQGRSNQRRSDVGGYFERSRDLFDPDCDPAEDLAEILRELCEEIFEEQLAGWYNDEATWPQNRGVEVFAQWLDFQHHSMLIDLCEALLILE